MLRGSIDGASRDRLLGWMMDPTRPAEPICLLVSVDGVLAFRLLADLHRADVEAAGLGHSAFDVAFQPPLSPLRPHTVTVRAEETGEECPGSPMMIPQAVAFDGATRRYLAAMLPDCATEEMDDRIEFLQHQTLTLRHLQAERRGQARQPDGAGSRPLQALMIDETMPTAGHDAGSNAIFSHAASLRRLGYAIVLVAADLQAESRPELLRAMHIETRHAPTYGSIEELLWYEGGQYDLVYLHRVSVASRYLQLVRHHMPLARVLYSVADLHHLRLIRQAQAEQRPELLRHADWVRLQEVIAAQLADAVLTFSTAEGALLRQIVPRARVHVVPWAVTPQPGAAAFEQRSGIAFIGHFAHAPNLNGALWLADEIMPLLRAAEPGMVCALIGSNMPAVLREPRPGIVPIGAVNDLADALSGVRLTVASLAFGAGVKGKVLDSLAAGVPCVCTPIAAEGLELGPALCSLIAADTAGVALSILRLYRDPALYAACRAEGLDLIASRHGEAQVDALMREAVQAPAPASTTTAGEQGPVARKHARSPVPATTREQPAGAMR
jgi:glycosyltransferase involved in cell wall biosynthesis